MVVSWAAYGGVSVFHPCTLGDEYGYTTFTRAYATRRTPYSHTGKVSVHSLNRKATGPLFRVVSTAAPRGMCVLSLNPIWHDWHVTRASTLPGFRHRVP